MVDLMIKFLVLGEIYIHCAVHHTGKQRRYAKYAAHTGNCKQYGRYYYKFVVFFTALHHRTSHKSAHCAQSDCSDVVDDRQYYICNG